MNFLALSFRLRESRNLRAAEETRATEAARLAAEERKNIHKMKHINSPYIFFLMLGNKRKDWNKFKKNEKELLKLKSKLKEHNKLVYYGISNNHQDYFERYYKAKKCLSKYILNGIDNLILDYDGMNINLDKEGKEIRKNSIIHNFINCDFLYRLYKVQKLYGVVSFNFDKYEDVFNKFKTIEEISDNFENIEGISSLRCYYPNIFYLIMCKRCIKNTNCYICNNCFVIRL